MDSDNPDDEHSYFFENSYWCYMPEAILVYLFKFLDVKDLVNVGLVCRNWYQVSLDELIWKNLFCRVFKVDKSIGLAQGATWRSEYIRLCDHIPFVQTEVLKDHHHQVLHVSFSHNGKYFATCSKDGYVLVWTSEYPAKVKYFYNMHDFSWKYTQYSQFNSSDTLLLVSGVHFGSPHSTSGEIAVFSIEDGFTLQCRVMNKPYDIFGTWYTDQHLLSGDLHWLAHLVSTSILWMNKANQETSSEHAPVTAQLFKFYNTKASSIRSIMVADCVTILNSNRTTSEMTEPISSGDCRHETGNPPSHYDLSVSLQDSSSSKPNVDRMEMNLGTGDYASPITYNKEYRQVEKQFSSCSLDNDDRLANETNLSDPECSTSQDIDTSESSTSSLPSTSSMNHDKILIFTTGSKTYTPHEIGFKRLKPLMFPQRLDPGPSLKVRLAMKADEDIKRASGIPPTEINWLDYESVAHKFDKVDHLIDLHGHIIGMRLSPDHRYLYVNSRPWPSNYVISNPLEPPPLAQEIDIHVIDLVTMKQVGRMLRAHKAYTPNNECFFIFLDVCNEYVASGAEDKHGYLWDRHYGICLAKFPHSDVVNSVAFNPRDPEMLVTASDDYTLKVWRSKAMVRKIGLNMDDCPLGTDLTNK